MNPKITTRTVSLALAAALLAGCEDEAAPTKDPDSATTASASARSGAVVPPDAQPKVSATENPRPATSGSAGAKMTCAPGKCAAGSCG